MSYEGLTKMKAREINETIRYTSWSVFKLNNRLTDGVSAIAELNEFFAHLQHNGIELRGAYDVSALRADADFLLWLHAQDAEQIQAALRAFSRTALGKISTQNFSAVGLHRPAEFNKGHVPAFMSGAAPKDWLCVYPFVRSYEWYLLPEDERRAMLMEHGMMGRDYPSIISNTVSSFALGDWEWILALESDVLHDIVDMMRHLRSSSARRHVRVEIPFYTGRLLEINELVELAQ
jgi:chlorite dismutase